jgi:protein involved in polysaccharide export with SLBB domain
MRIGKVIRPAYLLATLCLCALVCSAAENKGQPAPAPSQDSSPTLHQRYPRYTLRSGDSFDANFQFSPEFNQTLKVQPDGYISPREIGDMHVAGLTLPEVQNLLVKKYSAILKQPVISVTPLNLEQSYFIASGEVMKPGKYDLRGPITVTEALAIAGGLTQDRAKLSDVVLFRREGNTLVPGEVINIKEMLKHKNLSEDVYVKPGDLLYVPQNAWSKIKQILPTPGVGMQVMPGMPF